MRTEVLRIGKREAREGETFDVYFIVLNIDGRHRRYEGPALSAVDAIKDAYFYWTGYATDTQERLWGGSDIVFTEVPADPDNFRHLEDVPFFLHPPF